MCARLHRGSERSNVNDTDSDNDPEGDAVTQVASFLGFRTAHDARMASSRNDVASHSDSSSALLDETLDDPPRAPVDASCSANPDDETVDDRPRIQPDAVHFSASDATLNTVIDDNILMPLLHGGFDRLISASRATAGVKFTSTAPLTTAYGYEIKIVSPWMKDMTLRVGWSAAGSSLFWNDAQSISVDHTNAAYNGDNTLPTAQPRAALGPSSKWTKGDIIAVLLLRASSAHKCVTPHFAVYVNGVCTTGMIPVPSHLTACALFPHITFTHCSLASNFDAPQWTPSRVPCHWRMIAGSARDDVEYSLASHAFAHAELIVPCILGPSAWLSKYVDDHPHCVLLSKDALDRWAAASAVRVISARGEYGLPCLDDGGATIGALCRRRTIVYALSGSKCLLPTERARICALFPHAKKTAVVSFVDAHSDAMTASGLHATPPTGEWNTTPPLTNYDDASVPSMTENVFDAITFDEHDEQHAKDTLAHWKMDCKLRTRLDDLTVGPWFKQRSFEWRTFLAAEQQKTPHPNFPHFTKEDWMLANLRAQLHYLLVGFQKDVQDSSRRGFTPNNLGFYYKLYFGNDFFTVSSMFAVRRVSDLLELIPEVFAHQDGLCIPLLSEKTSAKQLLINTERARVARQSRVDAGDENAALRFAAPTSLAHGGSGRKPHVCPASAPEKRSGAHTLQLDDRGAQKSAAESGTYTKLRYDLPHSPRAQNVLGGVTPTKAHTDARRTPETTTRVHGHERSARTLGRTKSRSARRRNASRSRGNDAGCTSARPSAWQPLAPVDANARKMAGGVGEDRKRRRMDDDTRDVRGSARRAARR